MSSTVRRSDRRQGRGARLAPYVVVLLGLTLVGTLYTAFLAPQGIAQEGEEQEAAEPMSQSMMIKAGRDLYMQGCTTCHGINLEGGAGGPTASSRSTRSARTSRPTAAVRSCPRAR